MKRFICWYAYAGHETEGNLYLEEPVIFEAIDEADAMWKYHEKRFKEKSGNDMREWYKDVDDFRNRCEYITGWGFRCEQLAN
jgi:hypothetical protein